MTNDLRIFSSKSCLKKVNFRYGGSLVGQTGGIVNEEETEM